MTQNDWSMDLAAWFYSYFDMGNVVLFLIFVVAVICWTMDRLSKKNASTIDDLQSRVKDLEKRMGIKDTER